MIAGCYGRVCFCVYGSCAQFSFTQLLSDFKLFSACNCVDFFLFAVTYSLSSCRDVFSSVLVSLGRTVYHLHIIWCWLQVES